MGMRDNIRKGREEKRREEKRREEKEKEKANEKTKNKEKKITYLLLNRPVTGSLILCTITSLVWGS